MMKPWLIAGIQRFVVPPRLVTGQVLQQVHAQKIVTEQGFVEKALLEPCRGKITHRHSILSLASWKSDVVNLITSLFTVTGKSTFCRSPCTDFLPPSGGVFRLSLAGSSPCIPCRRSCGFKVQQAKRKQKSRHRTDQPCLRFFWKVMLVGYVTAESQNVQPRRARTNM